MTLRSTAALAALTLLSGCEFFGGGGPGGGTGGGNGADGGFDFTSGFVSIRKDDRNLYVADKTDLQTSQRLTDTGGIYFPSLSKDAKRVTFVKKTGTDTAIFVGPSSGGLLSLVQSSAASVKNLRNPVFSPDGMKIAFGYDDAAGACVGIVNVDGSGFSKLAGNGSLAYGLPSFFADGASVLVAAGNIGVPFSQIEKLNLSTGTPTSVTNTLGTEAQSIASRLLVSADGTRAVFDARISTGVTRIFGIDLSTKVVTKLNDYTGEPNTNDTFPCWMDANTVAYSSDSGGNDNVYSVGFDGMGRRLVLPTAVEPWYGPY